MYFGIYLGYIRFIIGIAFDALTGGCIYSNNILERPHRRLPKSHDQSKLEQL